MIVASGDDVEGLKVVLQDLVGAHAKHGSFLLARLSSEDQEYRMQCQRLMQLGSSASDTTAAAEMAKALSRTSLVQSAPMLGKYSI